MTDLTHYRSYGSSLVKYCIVLILLLTVSYHLLSASIGYPAYRDQHIGTAIDYARNGIDWLHPIIVGFNLNEVATPQEFPLWQALAGWLLRIGNEWWGMANIASLIFYCIGALALYQLTKNIWDSKHALWTVFAWLVQPLVFMYAGVASPDGASIAASIVFVWLTHLLLSTLNPYLAVPAVLSGAISATLKLPFFFSAGLFLALWQLYCFPKSIKRWLYLIAVGLFSGIVFMFWNSHCNAVLAQAQLPLVELRISKNSTMFQWYFGSVQYRLDLANWIRGGWRFLNSLLGSIALIAVVLGVIFKRQMRIPALWFMASIITTLVFTKIVLQHSHYYLMFSPAVAMCMGAFLNSASAKLINSRQHVVFFLLVLVGALMALGQGFIGMNRQLQFDPYHRNVAKIIQSHTGPEDRLLIQGGGWGGNLLILSNRRGFSINNVAETYEALGNLSGLHKYGFTKLVLVTPESPLLHAVQVVNPGQADRQRRFYEGADAPLIDSWPTLFRDERLCIKSIPEAE